MASRTTQPVPRSRSVLAVACIGQLMVVLDVSVLNVALPTIQRALEFDPLKLHWVTNAYTLAFGGFLLVGGRLADVWGRRRILLLGLASFVAASLVGGLAGDATTLVAARAAQGLAAAALAPVTLTLLTTSHPEGAARTRALAIWTATSIAGGAGGNLLGGVLTEFATWRAVLLINVPIGVVAMTMALRRLPGTDSRASLARLDLPGALAVTTGLVALAYGTARAPVEGWSSSETLAPVCVAVLGLGLFALIETRCARFPLLPPALLASRPVRLGNLAMLLAGASFQVPMWYFLTLYMQEELHFNAVRAGLGFLPHTLLSIAVGLWVTPRLMRRVSHRALVVAGGLLAACGFCWQSLVTAQSTYLDGVLGPAVLIAVGGGLFITPLTGIVVGGTAAGDAGAASGLMNTAKQAGGAVGPSALVALTAAPPGASTDPIAGYRHAFLAMAILLALTAAIALLLPARRGSAHPR